jgi:hypothetical protein
MKYEFSTSHGDSSCDIGTSLRGIILGMVCTDATIEKHLTLRYGKIDCKCIASRVEESELCKVLFGRNSHPEAGALLRMHLDRSGHRPGS